MEKLEDKFKKKLVINTSNKKIHKKIYIEKRKEIRYKTKSKTNLLINEITYKSLWENISKCDIKEHLKEIEYLLNEFGTKEPCNRFDVGNSIEYILGNLIISIGYKVENIPNAKRVDLCINDKYKISVKYSSCGNIKLHNSNNQINKDMNMTDLLLLLTLDNLYLIIVVELKKYNINIKKYKYNSGDGLILKRSFLKQLKEKNYPYIIDAKLIIDKSKCKNRLCSKLFYKNFKKEYMQLKS